MSPDSDLIKMMKGSKYEYDPENDTLYMLWCNIVGRKSCSGGSVVVWRGKRMVSELNWSLTAARYITDILKEIVMPYVPLIGINFLLMHDNGQPHTAAIVSEYLSDVGIQALEWPTPSPVLILIEHVWNKLGKQIKQTNQGPANVREQKIALVEE